MFTDALIKHKRYTVTCFKIIFDDVSILIVFQHVFVFDEVFDDRCSNNDVYENTAKPLVQHVLSG